MIYRILIFLFLSFSLFSQEYQSKEQRIDAIRSRDRNSLTKREFRKFKK